MILTPAQHVSRGPRRPRRALAPLFSVLLIALSATACSGKPTPPPKQAEVWSPEKSYRGLPDDAPSGYLDLRGIIHAHSVYSHDACDNAPRDPTTDAIDESCFQDLRRGICQVRHDFLMLTDHGESFARTEYPDTLLYRPDQGDTLIERGGGPVANWAGCDKGERTLILAGSETGPMPVGLEGHVPGTPEERRRIYGSADPADMKLMHDQGAVLLAAHTENWTDDELVNLPFDGFEMFNIHANLFLNFGRALKLIEQLARPEELPHPDLILLVLISEDPAYLGRWSRVLASGAHRVTTMATDVHRNTFLDKLQDDERIDSYRRLMKFYSNHLLVTPAADGSWNDRDLKDALRAGRAYGAFEYLGFPQGFDFHTQAAGARQEMGATVKLVEAPVFHLTLPTVRNLDREAKAPEIFGRILRATPNGWEELATGAAALEFKPTVVGAYRAEVRMNPYHLLGMLGDYEYLAQDQSFVWIYGNPIYVE